MWERRHCHHVLYYQKEKQSLIIANCKAGLAETCSHIEALLFFIEDYVSNEQGKTVTDSMAYWTTSAKK